jgi:deoxyribose-phosphate aldolase
VNIAASIEQTVLKADATPADVAALCDGAIEHGFVGVCVNPVYVPLAVSRVAGRSSVVSVVGFPLGAGSEHSDVAESSWLVDSGADEVDLVIPIGLAKAAQWGEVARRIAKVREATRGRVLKVILETGYFDTAQVTELARVALAEGVDYLKTSTGFGPRGASVADVQLLHQLAAETARVKASGGIRDLATARAMLDAGATRLGTSAGVNILTELEAITSER